MATAANQPLKPQLVESKRANSALKGRKMAAREFSEEFYERVAGRFLVTRSIKQTACDYDIPARTVGEILHLVTLRRGPTREGMGLSNRRFA